MLVAEELPRAPQPGLDLVHDEQGLVAPAQRLRRGPVLLRGEVDALALDGLDHEGGHVAAPQLAGQAVDVAEGHARGGEQGAEAVAELLAPVERQRPGGEPVEAVVAVDDPVALGGGPGELDGRLDGLGPRVGEEGALDAGVRPFHQRLGQEPGQQGAVHLDQVGQIGVEGLVDGPRHGGMGTAEGEDAEPGQEVEIAPALGVVEIAALAPHVVAVEPDRLEHPAHLRVHVLRLEGEVLPLAGAQNFGEVEGHQQAPGCATRLRISGPHRRSGRGTTPMRPRIPSVATRRGGAGDGGDGYGRGRRSARYFLVVPHGEKGPSAPWSGWGEVPAGGRSAHRAPFATRGEGAGSSGALKSRHLSL